MTIKPKRKRSKSTTARALDDLRKMGFTAGVVEKRLPHCFITKDLFGCIDIIAMRPGVGILAVQVTSGGGSGNSNHLARRRKSAAEPDLRTWLLSGGRFEVWSYSAAGVKGVRQTFTLRREELRVEDLTSDVTPAAPVREPLFAGGAL